MRREFVSENAKQLNEFERNLMITEVIETLKRMRDEWFRANPDADRLVHGFVEAKSTGDTIITGSLDIDGSIRLTDACVRRVIYVSDK